MGRHWAALQWQPSMDEATFARMLPPSALLAPVNDGDHAARLEELGIRQHTEAVVEGDEEDEEGSSSEEEEEGGEDAELARQAAERHKAAQTIQNARKRSLHSRGSLKWSGGDGLAMRYRTTTL